jgi:hypothetical protein
MKEQAPRLACSRHRKTIFIERTPDGLPCAAAQPYNFVRIHGSLRITPAMAANVTDRAWDDGGTLERRNRSEENSGMNMMSFDLLFLSSKDYPFPHPIANVFVKFATGKDYGGLGKGKSFVSNECASFQEFSAEIDRLQGELERLRVAARFQFDNERQRIKQ